MRITGRNSATCNITFKILKCEEEVEEKKPLARVTCEPFAKREKLLISRGEVIVHLVKS